MAGAPTAPSPYPATTRVIYDYAVQMLQAGQPFYISRQFNSDLFKGDGNFGFIQAILAAATAIATTVGNIAGPIASVAAVANMTGGGGSKSGSPTADDIATAIMPNVSAQLQALGINLPPSLAAKATAASIFDVFGVGNRNWVMIGAAGLGVLLLMKLLRR